MPVYPVAYTLCMGFMQVSQDFCSYTKSNMESNYIEKKKEVKRLLQTYFSIVVLIY